MATTELTAPEIHHLLALMRRVFVFIANLKATDPIASHIQYPKVPPGLSESMVVQMIRDGKLLPHLQGAQLSRGQKEADIVARLGSKSIKIEVKATGEAGFSALYEKDTVADHLVWVHFGRFCADPALGSIDVYSLDRPGQFFSKAQKITLQQFHKIAGTAATHILYSLVPNRGIGREMG